jgi:hypothetical protein
MNLILDGRSVSKRAVIAKLASFFGIGVCIALLSGCASQPAHKTPLTKEQILLQSDVKNKPPVVFQKGLEEVRAAGLRALTFVGCKVDVQDPLYLSGQRPRKFGLFIGSGGETVKVFLYPQTESETHVWVDTDLTFVGIAGQQGWNKQVLQAMTNALNEASQPPQSAVR